jgi:hypothetical protein
MSEMFDIYKNYSNLYDELVSHEDYKKNLQKYLNSKIVWKDKFVCEFGVGTGRISKMYLEEVKRADLYDNSNHMLEKAKINLDKWIHKINYIELDNRKINTVSNHYDIVIEGWSFGHLVVEEKNKKEYWIEQLIENSIQIANEKVVFIETMGTNVQNPTIPGETLEYFYKRIRQYGFIEKIIETNYLFNNYSDASRIMGNFFGEKMKNIIEQNKNNEIKEFTGVWIFEKS